MRCAYRVLGGFPLGQRLHVLLLALHVEVLETGVVAVERRERRRRAAEVKGVVDLSNGR